MGIGTIVFGGSAGDFATTRTLSVDFGSAADRALIVEVFNTGGSAGGVNSVVIDPAGANITMTAETQTGPLPGVGGTGYLRRFRAFGAGMPTGVKNVLITPAAGDSVINARAIPMDGVTSIAAAVNNTSTGTTLSATVTSATGRSVLMSSVACGVPDARTFTVVSPATLVKRVVTADHYFMHGIIVLTAGGASPVTPTVTASSGTEAATAGWDLTLSAPAGPNLTSPTGTVASSTSASIGVSTDTASGTLYRYVSTNATETAATVKASGTTSTVSATGAQGPFTASGLTAGLTYYAHFVHTAAAIDSAVSSAGPIYPGTWRPATDVSVSGWTATGAASNALALDEDTAGDSDYITSPTLSGTASTAVLALDESMPAGTYSLKVRARTTSGAGTLTVTAVNDAGTSQGVASPQVIDSTWTTYTLAITTTGTSTRIKLDVTT